MNDSKLATQLTVLKEAFESETDDTKRQALQEQIGEIELILGFDDIAPIPFGTPSDSVLVSTQLTETIKGQDTEKLIGMAEDFIKESNPKNVMDGISKAIDQLKNASAEKQAFKDAHADILNEKSDKDKAVRDSERTLAGLLAKHAQTGVRIVELEGAKAGLVELEIRDAEYLPVGTGYQLSYEMDVATRKQKAEVIDQVDCVKWALQWNPSLLTLDARRFEGYLKQLRVWGQGDRTADWYLPSEMPPATIIPKIQPTIGDIFAEPESE